MIASVIMPLATYHLSLENISDSRQLEMKLDSKKMIRMLLKLWNYWPFTVIKMLTLCFCYGIQWTWYPLILRLQLRDGMNEYNMCMIKYVFAALIWNDKLAYGNETTYWSLNPRRPCCHNQRSMSSGSIYLASGVLANKSCGKALNLYLRSLNLPKE